MGLIYPIIGIPSVDFAEDLDPESVLRDEVVGLVPADHRLKLSVNGDIHCGQLFHEFVFIDLLVSIVGYSALNLPLVQTKRLYPGSTGVVTLVQLMGSIAGPDDSSSWLLGDVGTSELLLDFVEVRVVLLASEQTSQLGAGDNACVLYLHNQICTKEMEVLTRSH